MIRRILVALDDSPRAASVIDAAAEIAAKFDAAIIPLRVVDVPPEFPAAGAGAHRDELPDHLAHEASADLARLVERAKGAYVAAPLIVVDPQPWRVIVEQADAHDVDLIVLGSHGYGGLDRVLGTTAGKVANMATRNVLVVHARS